MLERIKEHEVAAPNRSKCKRFVRDPEVYKQYVQDHLEFADFPMACHDSADAEMVEWGGGMGFNISGIPYGDEKYAELKLEEKTVKIESSVTQITNQLRDRTCQGLYSCLSYCKSPLL